MAELTEILLDAANGDNQASSQLLPLIYEELRRLAKGKVSQEPAGQTLNATALVHEAYLRLIGTEDERSWQNRGHFFAAAAEAMRRILVENARRKSRVRHGGGRVRVELADCDGARHISPNQLLSIDEAIEALLQEDQLAGQIVKLRYFAGLTVDETANTLGVSRATAFRHWKFAKAWIQCEMKERD